MMGMNRGGLQGRMAQDRYGRGPRPAAIQQGGRMTPGGPVGPPGGGLGGRMQQQAMLAQQMRAGGAPNPAGGRAPMRGNPRQQRAAMGGGRRY